VPAPAPDPRLQAFGFAVRDARERAGMSLDALADASGLSTRMLLGIEHGRRNPSLLTVLAVAQGLGIEPAALIAPAFHAESP
jgi:transcriptional regulator with XRE-family HTH domain